MSTVASLADLMSGLPPGSDVVKLEPSRRANLKSVEDDDKGDQKT